VGERLPVPGPGSGGIGGTAPGFKGSGMGMGPGLEPGNGGAGVGMAPDAGDGIGVGIGMAPDDGLGIGVGIGTGVGPSAIFTPGSGDAGAGCWRGAAAVGGGRGVFEAVCGGAALLTATVVPWLFNGAFFPPSTVTSIWPGLDFTMKS
jgi:hypothetical protein